MSNSSVCFVMPLENFKQLEFDSPNRMNQQKKEGPSAEHKSQNENPSKLTKRKRNLGFQHLFLSTIVSFPISIRIHTHIYASLFHFASSTQNAVIANAKCVGRLDFQVIVRTLYVT